MKCKANFHTSPQVRVLNGQANFIPKAEIYMQVLC